MEASVQTRNMSVFSGGLARSDSVTRTYPVDGGLNPSLVGWRMLGDGAGMAAVDSSGPGNHGALAAVPIFVVQKHEWFLRLGEMS